MILTCRVVKLPCEKENAIQSNSDGLEVKLMPTKEDLRYFQSLPLDIKVAMTQTRLREWINHFGEDGVYISFSGGKDSTVLLHIARQIYPDIKAVFVDTGLEYPEIKQFVKTFENVDIVRPNITFKQVICKYGYPMLSKEIAHKIYYYSKGSSWVQQFVNPEYKSRYSITRWLQIADLDFVVNDYCCGVMKKSPSKQYGNQTARNSITAQMADESNLRTQQWLRNGCNAFDCKRPISNPMSFWTEQDVLKYIKENNIPIASVYGDIVYEDLDGQTRLEGCGKLCTTGCHRTGCIFCGFGAHLEKGEGRFERLKRTHPKLYEYCMGGGAYGDDGIWRPDNRGLGMAHVIDELCRLYGKDFIKY